MSCEEIRQQLSLYLYGELSFDEEEAVDTHLDGCEGCRAALEKQRNLHDLMDGQRWEPPTQLLLAARREFETRTNALAVTGKQGGIGGRLRRWLGGWDFRTAVLKPAGALALVALGVVGTRAWDQRMKDNPTEPVTARVRYVTPGPTGDVRLVVEETRQRVLEGRPEDAAIHQMLLAAAKDPSDPGLRAQTMEVLKERCDRVDVRKALLQSLEADPNAGVRLKALDALSPFAKDAETRHVLSRVLLNDDNPGIRTRAIDLLVDNLQTDTIGTLQELLRKESNPYVRQRSMKALVERNASLETF